MYVLRIHDKWQEKMFNFYAGNLHQKLFSVIDFSDLNMRMSRIRGELVPDRTLPMLYNKDDITFLDVTSESSGSTTDIRVHVPVISLEEYSIQELIPIPIRKDDDLVILDIGLIEQ